MSDAAPNPTPTPAPGNAPTTPMAPAAAPSAAPSSDSPWYGGFADDLQGYAKERGFKDPESVLSAYKNLEKLRGVPEDRLLKLPEKADDAEGWNKIFSRLGKPEKPEGYGLEIKSDAEKDYVNAVQKMFYDSGLTTKQAQSLSSLMGKYVEEQRTALTASNEVKGKAEEQSLQKEWGGAFEQNKSIAMEVADKLGVSEQVMKGIIQSAGWANTVKLFHQIGAKTMESDFVSGNPASKNGAMTPAEARAERQKLMGDREFIRRLDAGDVQATAHIEKISKYIAADTNY